MQRMSEVGRKDVLNKLRNAGLRPTRHRVMLAYLLFDREVTRHISAQQLCTEAKAAGIHMSLKAVQNIVHEFVEAGLLQEVVLGHRGLQYDSQLAHHHHMISENRSRVACVPADAVRFSHLPAPPAGEIIDRIDVLIWTRKMD